jgi:hypothetical protein
MFSDMYSISEMVYNLQQEYYKLNSSLPIALLLIVSLPRMPTLRRRIVFWRHTRREREVFPVLNLYAPVSKQFYTTPNNPATHTRAKLTSSVILRNRSRMLSTAYDPRISRSGG